MKDAYNVKVIFSPALLPYYDVNKDDMIVVVDIFRATTSIVAAFEHGVKSIIPVRTIQEAKSYKDKGYIVASEREGKKLDFADLGNSAHDFMSGKLSGETIVYSTTNGTKVIQESIDRQATVVIGAFNNYTALSQWIKKQGKDVYILCSGYRNTFCIEDTLFAGALADSLLQDQSFISHCDSALIAMDMWKAGKDDMLMVLFLTHLRWIQPQLFLLLMKKRES